MGVAWDVAQALTDHEARVVALGSKECSAILEIAHLKLFVEVYKDRIEVSSGYTGDVLHSFDYTNDNLKEVTGQISNFITESFIL